MINLLAKIRKDMGKKTFALREKGILPGILYGPKIEKSFPVEVDLKEFEIVYQQAGESSLVQLSVDQKKFLVLIYDRKADPITGTIIHVDFYQPKLDEEIIAIVPLIFEGEALACKDLSGTLVKNIHEVEVRALPQNLPHEIKVNIEKLKTFEDSILIKDLIISKDVKILKDAEEAVALVSSPKDIEEELEKPIEEKVDEVEKVEKEKKEEEEDK